MPLAFRQQRGAPAKGPPAQSPSDAVRRSSGTRPLLQQLKAQPQEATLASSLGVLSPHPDAAIRRLEAEQRRRQREAERVEQTRLESSGIKWWQTSMPTNMHLLTTPGQHAALSQEALRSKRLLVLKFFTEDCYTCKSLLPKLKKIAADNPDVLFGELNGSDPSMVPLFMELNITRVPMVHFVKGGELKAAFTVSLNPEKLAMFRAEIAAHKDDAVRPAETLALMASDAR